MVGKFLLGMISGGLVVTGGLVVGSALFPMRPANDNAPSVVEEPIKAPTPSTAEAGPAVEETAAEPETAEVTTGEPADDAAATTEAVAATEPEAPTVAAAEPAAEPAAGTTDAPAVTEEAATAVEAATAPQPEVSATAPEAPTAEVAAAEPVAPAPAEVPKPETLAEPSKPAETKADTTAEAPDEPAETMLAEADPAPAVPETVAEVEPAPAAEPEAPEVPAEAAPTEPVAVAEPAEAMPEPAAEPAVAPEPETAAAEPVAEPPAPEPAPAVEPTPDPADSPAEETVTAEVAPAPELPAPEAPPAEPADSEPVAPETAPTDSVPAEPVPAEPAATDVAPEAEPAEPEPAEVPAEEAPAMDPAPAAPAPETAEADPTMPGTRPDALPGTLVEPQEPADAAEGKSSTFKPAPGLPRAGEGVIIDRGGETEPAPVDPAAPAVDPRPIAQFAAAFENPDAKPVFAIVLIDDGSPDLDREGLAALPFPVSFALDPLDPASAQHAATYRAAGREVVMMVTGIAEGAMPADVEVAFQSMEQGLPEAVAVMDLPNPAFQNRRPLAATVVPILKAQGRGLLTWDEGLNAADQVARREDLEAAVIFRDIGSSGEDAAAIRRLLDRAVFKAGQEGRVSVVGKADGATLAALLAWSIEGKAATVALAPVSAVLKVD